MTDDDDDPWEWFTLEGEDGELELTVNDAKIFASCFNRTVLPALVELGVAKERMQTFVRELNVYIPYLSFSTVTKDNPTLKVVGLK